MLHDDWAAYIAAWRNLAVASRQARAQRTSGTSFAAAWQELDREITDVRQKLQDQLLPKLNKVRRHIEEEGRPIQVLPYLEELRDAAGEWLGDAGQHDLAEFYFQVGGRLWDTDIAGARLAFERAMALDPGLEGAIVDMFQKRGDEFLKEGKLESGLMVFDSALTLMPKHQTLFDSLATQVLRHGQEKMADRQAWPQAARAFRWVRDLPLATPSFSEALNHLAKVERLIADARARILVVKWWTYGLAILALLACLGLGYVGGKFHVVGSTVAWLATRSVPVATPPVVPMKTATVTSTPSALPITVPTQTPSPTIAPTTPPSQIPSPTISPTTPPTQTPSPTISPTTPPSQTPSPTISPTATSSLTPSPSATSTSTPLASVTPASVQKERVLTANAYLKPRPSPAEEMNVWALIYKETKVRITAPPNEGSTSQDNYTYVEVEAFADLLSLGLDKAFQPPVKVSFTLRDLELSTTSQTKIKFMTKHFNRAQDMPTVEAQLVEAGSQPIILLRGWVETTRLSPN